MNPIIGWDHVDPVIGWDHVDPVIGWDHVDPVIGLGSCGPHYWLGSCDWQFSWHFLLTLLSFNRVLIYPLYMKGKPTPFYIVLFAFFFCTVNGYMQGRWLTHFQEYDESWLYHPAFVAGVTLFLLGQAINIHSDLVLQGLRKPGETGYKIPYGISARQTIASIFFIHEHFFLCMQVVCLSTFLPRTTLESPWSGQAMH